MHGLFSSVLSTFHGTIILPDPLSIPLFLPPWKTLILGGSCFSIPRHPEISQDSPLSPAKNISLVLCEHPVPSHSDRDNPAVSSFCRSFKSRCWALYRLVCVSLSGFSSWRNKWISSHSLPCTWRCLGVFAQLGRNGWNSKSAQPRKWTPVFFLLVQPQYLDYFWKQREDTKIMSGELEVVTSWFHQLFLSCFSAYLSPSIHEEYKLWLFSGMMFFFCITFIELLMLSYLFIMTL